MNEKKIVMPLVPTRMNAVRQHAPGGPTHVVYEQLETPAPGAGEVLVAVHAAAITRDELEWSVDRLPATPSYEFSGVVRTAGPGVVADVVGKPVYGLSPFDRDGVAADYAVVPTNCFAAKPHGLTDVESAAIPLSALTAWQALFDHGHLEAGQRVLIHGAAGAVGSFAVQLAHRHGAHVIGTAATDSLEALRQLGADEVIDRTAARFENVLAPVDLVFDTVGGDALERSPEVVRRGGTLVSVATEPSKERARDRGITAVFFIVTSNREQLAQIAKLAESGDLRPTLDQIFPIADASRAFQRSLSRDHRGKVVLEIGKGGER